VVTNGGALRLTVLAGLSIVGLRRVAYAVGDQVVIAVGLLELTFSSGAVVVLDPGPDGEVLRVRWSPWSDPFAGSMSKENREYIARSGRWAARDVSSDEPYRDIIGRALVETERIESLQGKFIGVKFRFEGHTLEVRVGFDELDVTVTRAV